MCFPAIGAAVAGFGSVGAATTAGMSTLQLGMIGASTVAGVASPLVSYVGQRQQAKAQERFQRAAAAAENQRFRQELTATRLREAQEQTAANEELADISVRTMEAVDRAAMNAQARGITGVSVDLLRDEIYADAGGLQQRIAQQQGFKETATDIALQQAEFVTQQRQIGIAKPISRPSLAVSGFRALSGGLDAYTRGRQIGATYET